MNSQQKSGAIGQGGRCSGKNGNKWVSFRKVEVETGRGHEMVMVYNLDPESVSKMIQVDLAGLDEEPESSIGIFSFHGCMCGVSAIKGRPPWEFHGQGDELLFVLAGESQLTVLENGGRSVQNLSPGQLAIVPQGHWHSNNAPGGVTMLWITPSEGNDHSWDEPTT